MRARNRTKHGVKLNNTPQFVEDLSSPSWNKNRFQMQLQLTVYSKVHVEWTSHHGLYVMSCQGNGDSAVCSTPAPGVNAGLRELLAMLLWLLFRDVGQETQRDRVPLLWQQQQQEAQADDAGGCEAHHAEDHLVFQNVHGCSRQTRRRDTNTSKWHGAAVRKWVWTNTAYYQWVIHFIPCVLMLFTQGQKVITFNSWYSQSVKKALTTSPLSGEQLRQQLSHMDDWLNWAVNVKKPTYKSGSLVECSGATQRVGVGTAWKTIPALPGTLSSVPMEMRMGYVSTTPTWTRMLNTGGNRKNKHIYLYDGEIVID